MPQSSSPPPSRRWHVPEDLLEAYAMGKSLGKDARRVHAHVLRCDTCCLRLVREAQFIDALHYALYNSKQRKELLRAVGG